MLKYLIVNCQNCTDHQLKHSENHRRVDESLLSVSIYLDLDLIFLLFLFSLLIRFFLHLALILKRLSSANGAFLNTVTNVF